MVTIAQLVYRPRSGSDVLSEDIYFPRYRITRVAIRYDAMRRDAMRRDVGALANSLLRASCTAFRSENDRGYYLGYARVSQ